MQCRAIFEALAELKNKKIKSAFPEIMIPLVSTEAEIKIMKDLDFIIVDMPPGTGDTQLTFSQEIKMDGAIIVSTPQEVALLDVKRGIKMFDKLGVKILGLVDNMSYFTGDDGKKYKIFGEGGVRKTAEEFEKEFLGEIPINPEVGKNGDEGKPIVEANPEHEISKIYLDFANKIKSTYL
jgi:ATP-binding protein involved in chromosome partitioning